MCRSKMADLQASNEIALQTVADREAAIGEAHGRLLEAKEKRDAFGNQVQSCLLIYLSVRFRKYGQPT
jgi:hypothetical protein